MAKKQLDDRDMMILRCARDRMTFREMATAVLLSPSVIFYRVTVLQEMGLLSVANGKARSVMLTDFGKAELDKTSLG